MKKQVTLSGIIVLCAIIFFSGALNHIVAQTSSDSGAESSDSSKVSKADERPEMRTYYVAFLRRGPEWTAEMTPEVEKVLEGHFAHIRKMTDEGKLALAGPFFGEEGEGALAGMFIFRVDSMEEAQEIAKNDPGIQSGRFTVKFYQWYGPANLS